MRPRAPGGAIRPAVVPPGAIGLVNFGGVLLLVATMTFMSAGHEFASAPRLVAGTPLIVSNGVVAASVSPAAAAASRASRHAGIYVEAVAGGGVGAGQLAAGLIGLVALGIALAALVGEAWSVGLVGLRVAQGGRRPAILVGQLAVLVGVGWLVIVASLVAAEVAGAYLRHAAPLGLPLPWTGHVALQSLALLGRSLVTWSCWAGLGVGIAAVFPGFKRTLLGWGAVLLEGFLTWAGASPARPWLAKLSPLAWTASWMRARSFGVASHVGLIGQPTGSGALRPLAAVAMLVAMALAGLALAWWRLSRGDLNASPLGS
jgi:hypothetical protein